MNPNLDDVVSYYKDRLILQYRGLPKATQTIAILCKQAVCDYLTQSLQVAFDVNTAVGVQLDIIGKYVGISRLQGTSSTVNTYGFERYPGHTGNPHGLQRYAGGVNTGIIWMRYGYLNTNPFALSDDAYRILIQLKIILNSSDNTLYSIQKLLNQFFPGTITVVDNTNMTLTYYIAPDISQTVPISIIEQFLPKPMGVGINFVSAGNLRVLSDGTTIRTLSDNTTERVTT